MVAPGVVGGPLYDAVPRMELYLALVQFKGDIAVEDKHVIDRLRRVPAVLANALGRRRLQGLAHGRIGRQVNDAPARAFGRRQQRRLISAGSNPNGRSSLVTHSSVHQEIGAGPSLTILERPAGLIPVTTRLRLLICHLLPGLSGS